MVAIRGGDKLQARLAELSKRVSKASEVRVGFLEGATYEDGTPVAMVAAIQNFGAPSRGIPPRPFMSNMVAQNGDRWGDDVAELLPQHGYDAQTVLTLMGEEMKGELRQSIVDTDTPPLSPVTLMLRKMKADDPDLQITGATVGEAARRVKAGESYGDVSSKPLVDTGYMLSRIDSEVR